MMNERQFLEGRISQAKSVRKRYDPDWKDILEQSNPHRPRFDPTDHNKGTPRDRNLFSSVPARSCRIFSAGLVASMTSPARRWFMLSASDPQAQESSEVKSHLALVERIIYKELLKSRFYQMLAAGTYPDLASIATACGLAEQARTWGLSFRGFPPGSYWLDVDSEGRVDTLFWLRPWSVRQLIQEFGEAACSTAVRNCWTKGSHNDRVNVWRAIYPNVDFVHGRLDRSGKRWSSDWWEEGQDRGWLRRGGFEESPIIAPRWNAADGETYGTGSPGWESKCDARQLQHQEANLVSLSDKMTNPPMRATQGLDRASLFPGRVTYLPPGDKGMYEPAQEVRPGSIHELENQIQRPERRVEQAYFVDLFLSILRDERAQRPTATEILEQRQEVMLQLGPLLDVVNQELLEPSVMRAYSVLERQGVFPPTPRELQGSQVKVEFISVLHQAQRMTGLAGVRELVAQVITLVQAGKYEVIDKVDADKVIDEIAEMLGVNPDIVLSEKKVGQIRAAKAQRQQAQDKGQAMLAASEGVRNVAGVEPQKLQELAGMLAPVAAAAGGMTPTAQ